MVKLLAAKPTPVADAPVADAPVADAQVADAPVADAPVADAAPDANADAKLAALVAAAVAAAMAARPMPPVTVARTGTRGTGHWATGDTIAVCSYPAHAGNARKVHNYDACATVGDAVHANALGITDVNYFYKQGHLAINGLRFVAGVTLPWPPLPPIAS